MPPQMATGFTTATSLQHFLIVSKLLPGSATRLTKILSLETCRSAAEPPEREQSELLVGRGAAAPLRLCHT